MRNRRRSRSFRPLWSRGFGVSFLRSLVPALGVLGGSGGVAGGMVSASVCGRNASRRSVNGVRGLPLSRVGISVVLATVSVMLCGWHAEAIGAALLAECRLSLARISVGQLAWFEGCSRVVPMALLRPCSTLGQAHH